MAVTWVKVSLSGEVVGRKAMTNLDTVLKSRDITLLTKVHIVKAMVFPVVVYGCESWTVKKAECCLVYRVIVTIFLNSIYMC